MPLFRHDSCGILEYTGDLNFLKVYTLYGTTHVAFHQTFAAIEIPTYIKINSRLIVCFIMQGHVNHYS